MRLLRLSAVRIRRRGLPGGERDGFHEEDFEDAPASGRSAPARARTSSGARRNQFPLAQRQALFQGHRGASELVFGEYPGNPGTAINMRAITNGCPLRCSTRFRQLLPTDSKTRARQQLAARAKPASRAAVWNVRSCSSATCRLRSVLISAYLWKK